MTKRAAVIGWPISHSLSPRLHNYWLKKYKIDGEYTAIPVKPEELEEFIKGLPNSGLCGINITIPHKETAYELLNSGRFSVDPDIDGITLEIGAINTVVINEDSQLKMMNTDAYGFAENIRPHIKEEDKIAVVFGAGGAANAVWAALTSLGFNVIVTNRNETKLSKLKGDGRYTIVGWEHRNDKAILQNADLLVNATSLGMIGKEELQINLDLLPKTALVTDIVYNPLETSLLKRAKECGNRTVDGLGMLLHQGAKAFEAWFGVLPEVTDELRKHVLEGITHT